MIPDSVTGLRRLPLALLFAGQVTDEELCNCCAVGLDSGLDSNRIAHGNFSVYPGESVESRDRQAGRLGAA